jgi:RimJ/RimL family protein N-acetyltransferase
MTEQRVRATLPNTRPATWPYAWPMEIRVGGLILRAPGGSDLDAIVKACQDPDVQQFIPFVPVPYGEEDGRAWLASVERAWAESDERTFGIFEEENGRLRGVVTVRLRERGSVGYWLAPSARGRGLMSEAVRAVVRWARDEHGIQRLTLTTHPANLTSQRVAERAGFSRIGMTESERAFRDGTTTAVLFELE